LSFEDIVCLFVDLLLLLDFKLSLEVFSLANLGEVFLDLF